MSKSWFCFLSFSIVESLKGSGHGVDVLRLKQLLSFVCESC